LLSNVLSLSLFIDISPKGTFFGLRLHSTNGSTKSEIGGQLFLLHGAQRSIFFFFFFSSGGGTLYLVEDALDTKNKPCGSVRLTKA
jgi:hypothetical protein